MKLIGFRQIKGEKDGRSWNFVQLIIDKEEMPVNNTSAGVQLLMQRRNGSYVLPTVPYPVWSDAVTAGVHIGSNVKLYQDFEGNIKLDADNPFTDLR